MFWKKEAYCNLNLFCRVEILQEKWGSTLKHRSLCDHWVKIILFSEILGLRTESEDWNFTQQFSLLIFILYQRNKKRFLNPTYVHLKLISWKLIPFIWLYFLIWNLKKNECVALQIEFIDFRYISLNWCELD